MVDNTFAAELDGGALSLMWGLPFAGLLLSIALFPLLAHHFWYQHFGKVTLGWALSFFLPFIAVFGLGSAWQSFVHATLVEYIPFVVLLTALFSISGGIYIKGNLRGTPLLNTAILALGAVLASIMGTTGASMLLIRPLLRTNDDRKNQAHIVIFFIFIVSNIGGSLTPLGDPPLFLGFLKGVTFFWTLTHLWPETLFTIAVLLTLFYALESWFYQKAPPSSFDPTSSPPESERLGISGALNFLLLAGVIGLVLMSGLWQPAIALHIAGTELGLQSLLRDAGLIVLTGVSLTITSKQVHQSNQFSWLPMLEVAKLFAGIFLTFIPVIAMLKAGVDGPFSAVLTAVTNENGQPVAWMYFWATGALSAFLDNAPTYLVFFNATGASPQTLMTSLASTLSAISAGAVFMGALSYIGNAPNLMVKTIAENRGVKMPSFFGYMAWSFTILIPVFVIVSIIWY